MFTTRPNLGRAPKVLIPSTSHSGTQTYLFNPKIISHDESLQGFWEGCLSIPGIRGFVKRPKNIRLSYRDISWKKHIITVSGFLATVVQHEIDHLKGVLFLDRVDDKTKMSFLDEYHEFHTND